MALCGAWCLGYHPADLSNDAIPAGFGLGLQQIISPIGAQNSNSQVSRPANSRLGKTWRHPAVCESSGSKYDVGQRPLPMVRWQVTVSGAIHAVFDFRSGCRIHRHTPKSSKIVIAHFRRDTALPRHEPVRRPQVVHPQKLFPEYPRPLNVSPQSRNHSYLRPPTNTT